MADIDLTCPHCRQVAQAPAELAGQTAECPSCGKDIQIPSPSKAPAKTIPRKPAARSIPPPHQTTQPPKTTNEVVVTDIKMPFGSMVTFMIKWAIAAIPAFIILTILGWLVFGILIGGCAAMLGGM